MDSDGTQIVIFDYNIPVTENITVRMFSRQRLMCMLFTVYSLCYKDNFFFVFLYISACVDTLPLILSFCYQYSVETFVLFTLHITVYLKSAKSGILRSIRNRILRSRYQRFELTAKSQLVLDTFHLRTLSTVTLLST